MSYSQPVLLLVIIVLVIAGVAWRHAKRSRALVILAIAVLFLWSWEPAAYLSCATLEWRYPIRDQPDGDAEAIVVLAGGAVKRTPSQADTEANFDTTIRTRYAGWLYKNWRQLPIVVSGGPSPDGIILANVMRQIRIEQGVPPADIWVEDRSRSTAENASFSAELLRAKRIHQIALVTEAIHMPRAEKAFEHEGLNVTPAPCNFRCVQFHGEWGQLLPSAKAIEKNECSLHEWLGIAWYWITGKI